MTTATPPTGPVVASVRIAAPPHIVFPYFTDPALATRWLADAADLDARPGGTFSLDIRGDGKACGSFVEVDPPQRVVFTWGVPDEAGLPPGSTTVEVTLEPDGDETVVTLTHRELPASYRRSHEEGWSHFLSELAPLAGSAR